MASFRKLTNGHTKAIVRSIKYGLTRTGELRSRTAVFPKKTDAERWAADIEAGLAGAAESKYHDLKLIKVGGILREFVEQGAEKMLKPTGATFARQRLTQIQRDEPVLCNLDMTNPAKVADALRDYRDKLQRPVRDGGYGNAPATATRNLAIISTAFKWGIEVQRMPIENPVRGISKPNGRGRKREFTWSESLLEKFLTVAGFDYDTKPEQLKDLFPWTMLLARVTGFRVGDILSIQKQTRKQADRRVEDEWKGYIDLSVPEIYFPGTVTDAEGAQVGGRKADGGKGWHAPLTADAEAILKKLLAWFPIDDDPDLDFKPDQLIPMSDDYHGTCFQRLKKLVATAHPDLKAQLERPNYITFHGLRHTFTTELVNAYTDPGQGEVDEATKMALLAMTGRKTLASLNEYFHPDPGALARRMTAKMPGLGMLKGSKEPKRPALKVVNS
jgi:integrase